MESSLQASIARQLSNYSDDINVWSQDIGDTFLTFGYRVFLQEYINDLTEGQLKQLHEIDQRVLALNCINYENINSDDVEFINRIADVINGIAIPHMDD